MTALSNFLKYHKSGCARPASLVGDCNCGRDEAHRELDELIALLQRIEFAEDGRCPSCDLYISHGHALDCELRAVLDKHLDPRTDKQRGEDEDYDDLKNTLEGVRPQ